MQIKNESLSPSPESKLSSPTIIITASKKEKFELQSQIPSDKKELDYTIHKEGMLELFQRANSIIKQKLGEGQHLEMLKNEKEELYELLKQELILILKREFKEQCNLLLVKNNINHLTNLFIEVFSALNMKVEVIEQNVMSKEIGQGINFHVSKENDAAKSFENPYDRAQLQGKSILYICAKGEERSVSATNRAKERDEPHTDFLRSGYLGLQQEIYGAAINKVKAKSNAFGKHLNEEEEKALHSEIVEETKRVLKERMIRRGWNKKVVRIFNDEAAFQGDVPMIDILVDVMADIGVEYELVTTNQIKNEHHLLSGEDSFLKADQDNSWF